MKNKSILIAVFFSATAILGCTNQSKDADQSEVETVEKVAVSTWTNNATIYEVNLRHYSDEGTINAFIPHLDRLDDLGIDILWIMPIHPIGAVKRKATGDVFVEDMEGDLVQNLITYPGSPYSVQNYRAVNSDFGSTEDFKKLVSEAHSRGMKVILDWVANHTAWDHQWISDHPDWYTHKNGKITDPLNDEGESIGWTDVADLNYDNKELWQAMASDMKYWVDSCDIDGFRCDVAFEVPAEFWRYAIDEIEKSRDVFMLAEAEGHNMQLYDSMFDMYYAWNVHHQMNELSKGNIDAAKFISEWRHVDYLFGDKAFPMNFITNHDENSWNGTVFERMNESWRLMAVMSYALRGMPLIYTGQEVGLDERLPFFKKGLVDWHSPKAESFTGFYKKLNELKEEPSLAVNSPISINQIDGLITIRRADRTFILNTGSSPINMNLDSSKALFDSHRYDHDVLDVWGYVIY